ncbi:MAG: hypothetical protein M0R06_00755 [Sphaerochaeta sp.]|jgi:DNA-binding IscR family transcriptional regulator|nr:hypothetical protein [Sphaerochaeta sp.]
MGQTEVLNAMKVGEKVTTYMLEERTGIPKRQLSQDMTRLRKHGLVKCVGTIKGGWKVWERV